MQLNWLCCILHIDSQVYLRDAGGELKSFAPDFINRMAIIDDEDTVDDEDTDAAPPLVFVDINYEDGSAEFERDGISGDAACSDIADARSQVSLESGFSWDDEEVSVRLCVVVGVFLLFLCHGGRDQRT